MRDATGKNPFPLFPNDHINSVSTDMLSHHIASIAGVTPSYCIEMVMKQLVCRHNIVLSGNAYWQIVTKLKDAIRLRDSELLQKYEMRRFSFATSIAQRDIATVLNNECGASIDVAGWLAGMRTQTLDGEDVELTGTACIRCKVEPEVFYPGNRDNQFCLDQWYCCWRYNRIRNN